MAEKKKKPEQPATTGAPISAASRQTECAPGQIAVTLGDYLERGGETWFLTGKKRYSVQAMMVSRKTSFHNEMEVTDYTVEDDGITVILKGSSGEMWTSGLQKVIATYTDAYGRALTAESFAVRDVFIDVVTRSEPGAYYAMYVPLRFSVTVETARGNVLHTNLPNAPHGDGDYLICRRKEDGGPNLSDVWVLNGAVFPERYDTGNRREASVPDGI